MKRLDETTKVTQVSHTSVERPSLQLEEPCDCKPELVEIQGTHIHLKGEAVKPDKYLAFPEPDLQPYDPTLINETFVSYWHPHPLAATGGSKVEKLPDEPKWRVGLLQETSGDGKIQAWAYSHVPD